MKLVSDSAYSAMKQAADNWQKLTQQITQGSDEQPEQITVESLMDLLKGRKSDPKEGSYTTYLFEKGIDKILKKVGEESTEVIIAAKAGDKRETIYEVADLMCHVMVMMVEMGISTQDILAELASRHVIDKKVKQEKMT